MINKFICLYLLTLFRFFNRFFFNFLIRIMKMKKDNTLPWLATIALCLEILIFFIIYSIFDIPVFIGLPSTTVFVLAVVWLGFNKFVKHKNYGRHNIEKDDNPAELNLKESNVELQNVTRVMRKQIYDLHNLFEVSINLTSILEPQQLLKSSMLSIIGQLRSNQAMVFLPGKKDSNIIYPIYAKGYSKQQWDQFSISLEDPFFKKFHKKMIAINLREADKKLLNEKWLKLIENGISLIAPIIHKRHIKGIIALGQKMNQELFTQSEKEIFSLLTHFISVAFSNSILYQKMEISSITDGLTGLYNFRFFKKRLYDEMLRAKRYKHSLSLILFDVDNFKNYNDTLGHPAGDRALKKIAELVKSSVRKSDIAVRYGGEEFCIILPEEDIQAARMFGERFRKKIEDYQFFKEEVQPGGKLTISLGEATYPEDAESMQDLIEKTDAALYKAKNLGRNRICLFSETD